MTQQSLFTDVPLFLREQLSKIVEIMTIADSPSLPSSVTKENIKG